MEVLEGKKVVEVACGRSFTLFLTDKGEVYACGIDDMGQLGGCDVILLFVFVKLCLSFFLSFFLS